MKKFCLLIVLLFGLQSICVAQHEIEDFNTKNSNKVFSQRETGQFFVGKPIKKISESGNDRVVEDLNKKQSAEYMCEIMYYSGSGRYLWASRDSSELIRVDSGGFVTFFSKNGSGYIRLIKPEMKEIASFMGETETTYDYVEHLLLGLKTITYYGVRK